MKAQKRLDKVLEIAIESVQEEVGALMGVSFKLSEPFTKIVSKEEYFEEILGKKIVAKMDVTGEVEGFGGLVIDLKDGIRLGGTLIMLPQAELEDVVKNESYTEETEDSYGEIANIIAGAYTKVFEDNFPKNCRFVRKEQGVVSSVKVDIESDEPVPNQWYYLVRAEMTMEGLQMGELDFLLPAQPFGLEVPGEVAEPAAESSTAAGESQQDIEQPAPLETETESHQAADQQAGEESEAVSAAEEEDAVVAMSPEETAKQKKLIDKLLDQCRTTVGKEVGALLGVDVKLGKPVNSVVDKEQFFLEETSGKQVMAHMEVADDLQGESYLFVSMKDAIRIGSILIMLPPSELESAVSEEDFTADAEDAYGEIANIISGSYTSIFQEQYIHSIRLIKKELEVVSPMKVDNESDDTIPRQHYYMNSCQLTIDGKEYGKVTMLFPLDLFNLSTLVPREDEAAAAAETQSTEAKRADTADVIQGGKGSSGAVESSAIRSGEESDYDVVIVQNNPEEAEKIAGQLDSFGVRVKVISYNDNIKQFMRNSLKLVVIVMKEVDEQAYGVTIKVNTLCSVPIVAAGAEWTRSKVIKAVKYGVKDILLTPASADDIREKVDNNMLRLAA